MEVEIVLGLRPQAQRHCREQVARLLAGNLDDMLAEVEKSS